MIHPSVASRPHNPQRFDCEDRSVDGRKLRSCRTERIIDWGHPRATSMHKARERGKFELIDCGHPRATSKQRTEDAADPEIRGHPHCASFSWGHPRLACIFDQEVDSHPWGHPRRACASMSRSSCIVSSLSSSSQSIAVPFPPQIG